ncbi:MAG: type II toxin-antitoxin system RelE/ParE family toxin [Gammaproteobacteria bacterium]
MARVELAPDLVQDFERILAHLVSFDVRETGARIRAIMDALDVLERNPMIGRPDAAGLRELVIGRRARGYVALYHYDEVLDIAFVLAIRHQTEAGFKVR